MKYLALPILVFVFAVCSNAQALTGTIYDPNGAVIPRASIKALDEKGISSIVSSNDQGKFEIRLAPGLYALEVSCPGFITIKYREFLMVNSTYTRMMQDFVLFGTTLHETFGYGGGNTSSSERLIRSYEVTQSPKLKAIKDKFAPVTKLNGKKSN